MTSENPAVVPPATAPAPVPAPAPAPAPTPPVADQAPAEGGVAAAGAGAAPAAAAAGAGGGGAGAATATATTPPAVDPLAPVPFIWKIDNFSQRVREDRVHSEEFKLAGRTWRMLMMPHPELIAMWLQIKERLVYPSYPHVKFRFICRAIVSGAADIIRESDHVFTPQEDDRGFHNYMGSQSWRDYVTPADTVTLEIYVDEVKKPVSEFGDYPDFKQVVGFVGLKNQGATCYMNSLLQALYNLPQFRKAVYMMPTEAEAKTGSKSIALALQRVFYQMQYAKTSVTTKQLTSSFGWDSLDAFMQHDVQEFSRVLCDSLEENMKGTPVDGTMQRLFQGSSQMYIECVNVPYKSERIEAFYDLALNVKGCPTLEHSFKQYIEIEKMEGDNRIRAEKHGLQDARKGCRFLKFPPILQLQLKRFEFDPNTSAMVKVNDRFEFPTTLNLDPFLAESVARDEKNPETYYLHSVLVHSGSVHGGHYYSFIRPITPTGKITEQQWYKFDDESVYRVSEDFAVKGSFGGEYEQVSIVWGKRQATPVMRFANAYMLIYVRKSQIEELQRSHAELAGVPAAITTGTTGTTEEKKAAAPGEAAAATTAVAVAAPAAATPAVDEGIKQIIVHPPEHLIVRFKNEEAVLLAKAEEARQAYLYTEIKVLCENDLIKGGPCAIELNLEERNSKGQIMYRPVDRSYRVKRDSSLVKWAEEAEKNFGIPVARQQWWLLSMRENSTIRPNNWMPTPEKSFDDCETKRQKCHFYLRDSELDQYGHPDANKLDEKNAANKEGDRSLILLKYFDVKRQKLVYAGSLILFKSMKMHEVVRMAKDMLEARGLVEKIDEKKAEEAPKPATTDDAKEGKEAPKGEAAKKEEEAKQAAAHEAVWQGIGMRAYEEEKAITYKIIEEKDPNDTLLELRFRHGDMIVFQRIYSPTELATMKEEHKRAYSTFQERLQSLQRVKDEADLKVKEEKERAEAEAKGLKPGEAPKAAAASAAAAAPKAEAAKAPAKVAVDMSPGALAAAREAGVDTVALVDIKKEEWLVSMWEEVKPDFYETIKDYVRFMADRILVGFRKTPWPLKKEGSEFSLELAKGMRYDDLVTLLGTQLKVDPMRIRLRRERQMAYEEGPEASVIPRDRETMLIRMLTPNKEQILYYEISPYSWLELEHNRVLEVHFLHINLKLTRLDLLVPKEGTFSNIGDMVKERMEATLLEEDKEMWLREQKEKAEDLALAQKEAEEKNKLDGTPIPAVSEEDKKVAVMPEFKAPRAWRALRYVQIDDSRRPKRICMLDQLIRSIPEPEVAYEKLILRVEEELPGEALMTGGERAIWAGQYYKTPHMPRVVGPVFAFIIKPTEKFKDTKRRLQRRLQVPDEKWAKWSFCQLTRYYDRDSVKDHFLLTSLDWSGVERGDTILGLEDPDYKSRSERSGAAAAPRQLKIYNKEKLGATAPGATGAAAPGAVPPIAASASGTPAPVPAPVAAVPTTASAPASTTPVAGAAV